MQVVVKCLHFVMSYINQNKKRKQTLESAQHGLEIIFNNVIFLCSVMVAINLLGN